MMKELAIAATLLTAVITSPASAQGIEVFTNGSRPTGKGPAETFTGTVMVDQLMGARPQTRVGAGHVTFEPGARSAWHTHPAGQILIVTSEGYGRAIWRAAMTSARYGRSKQCLM